MNCIKWTYIVMSDYSKFCTAKLKLNDEQFTL